jgi:hypothetical protein
MDVDPAQLSIMAKVREHVSGHSYSVRLLDALAEGGWVVQELDPRIGSVQFMHPRNRDEVPTPPNTPRNWWPGSTYSIIEHVTIHLSGHRIISIFLSEHRAPWVNGSMAGPTSFKAAHRWLETHGEHREVPT